MNRPRPTLWLHIGAPKTGTTALQVALECATADLLKHGWLYPLTGRLGPGHHRLARAVSLSRPDPEGTDLFAALRTEVEATSPTNVFISSEDFFLDCELAVLSRQLAWADVRVIVYVRRAENWIRSYFAQYVKDDYYRFSDVKRDKYDALGKLAAFAETRRLRSFADAFGHEALIVRSYDEPGVRRDLVSDVCAVVGLPEDVVIDTQSSDAAHTINVSIMDDELELVRLSNVFNLPEAERDRWLFELQAVSLRRRKAGRVSENKFDLALDTGENSKTLRRIEADTRALVREYAGVGAVVSAAKDENVGECDTGSTSLSSDVAPLKLAFTRAKLSFDSLIDIQIGMTSSRAKLLSDANGLAGAVSSFCEPRSKETEPLIWPSTLIPRNFGELRYVFNEGHTIQTPVRERHAIVLTGAAARLEQCEARLGLASLIVLGVADRSNLYVASSGDMSSKWQLSRVRNLDDLNRLAAGQLAHEPHAPDRHDTVHVFNAPIFAMQPLIYAYPNYVGSMLSAEPAISLLAPANDIDAIHSILQMANSPESKSILSDVKRAERKIFKPFWSKGGLPSKVLAIVPSGRLLPTSQELGAFDDRSYARTLIEHWDLAPPHTSLVMDYFLPILEGIERHVGGKQSASKHGFTAASNA